MTSTISQAVTQMSVIESLVLSYKLKYKDNKKYQYNSRYLCNNMSFFISYRLSALFHINIPGRVINGTLYQPPDMLRPLLFALRFAEPFNQLLDIYSPLLFALKYVESFTIRPQIC